MATGLLKIFIVSNILGYVLVNGRPGGAPQAACEDGTNIVPGHIPNLPSTSPVPYSVNISGIPSSGYVAGQNYIITLRGSAADRNFRGFMIQGRVHADDSPAGTFGSGNNYQPQCSGNTAATHRSRLNKRTVNLVWTAPPADTGCICFRYAFVDAYTRFWANLTTPCVSEDLQTEIRCQATGSVNGSSFAITLNCTVNGEFECSLDGGSFQSCSSGNVFSNLSVGFHNVVVRFTPDGHCQLYSHLLSLNFSIPMPSTAPPPVGFSVRASAIYSGDKITVTYEASAGAVCTCQLDSGSPVSCDSGHMFNNVPEGEHTVIVRCTSADGLMTASSTVSGLQFLSVQLTLESSGTSITVITETNIEATHRCRLDDGPFVDCFAGFQFQGVSGGRHTVTVESTSLNRLTSLNTTGTTTVRGRDAILITDITPSINIAKQYYTFTFNINEKLEDLNITLLIDGSPITVPFDCVYISDEMCYCTFRIANMEYAIGPHTLTFQSILNGEVRGSTSTMFLVTDVASASFKDTEYSVVEGDRIFRVEIEKVGIIAQAVTLSIQFIEGTAMSRSDYPVFQAAQAVMIPPGPSIEIPVNLTIKNDEIVECNETFTLRLVKLDAIQLQIDPAHDQATVTIIDDDATTVAFSGSPSITEGNTGPVGVAYQGTIAQNFTVTVESYQCSGTTSGVDYEPVNVKLTFTPTLQSQNLSVMTIDDDIFEDDEHICLRLTNLIEPCPSSVILGDDTEVVIAEDESPVFILQCYTNTTGNSIIGRTISLFYFSPAMALFFPQFQCALDDRPLEPCADPPPTVYGPLSYGNHTVTVRAQSGVTLEEITITHQVLMVQARLHAVNSSAVQISIQSTTDATYRCKLNDGQYFQCNDGDVVSNLPPMMYTLMVEATNIAGNNPPQYASDIVGPLILTGGSSGSTCAGSISLISPGNFSSYQAEWRSRGDRVVFTLRGEGQGWVAIGFSHNRMMAISDIIVGAVDESNYFVDDRFSFTRDISARPPRDPIQNIDNTFASFEDFFTTVKFSRQKETGDVNDFSLNDCIFFLFAWGGAVTDVSSGQIEYHGFGQRFISDSLMCLLSSSFCPERVDCGQPGTPINGAVMLFNDTMEDSVAVYSCNFGFRLVGDRERTCQFSRFVDQMWTGEVPTCMRITCGDPGVPMNGMVTSNGTFVTSIADFTCDFGFELIGNSQRICQPNGIWSNMVPECRHTVLSIDCGDPGMLRDGVVSYEDTHLGSVAEFTCNFGFKLTGDGARTCRPDGMWSHMVPTCIPLDCGRPAIPTNTFAIYENTTVGSTVTYFCNSSSVLCGNNTCLPSGIWAGSVHNCIRAVVNMAHTMYVVNEGDRFANITVLLDQPSCVTASVIVVPQLQSPRDARKSDFDNTPIMFDISPGDINANVSIPITNDIKVERDEKFDVILRSNGSDVVVGSPKQATVTIMDDDAIRVSFQKPTYAIKDKRVRVCLTKTGEHDFSITVLLRHLDPEGSEISNHSLKFSTRKLKVCYKQSTIGGENITSFNITIVPSKHVRIGTHGSTRIIMRCEDPGRPANGQSYNQSLDVGRTVTYRCDDGFELEGDQSRKCLETGHWSGSVPVCKSISNCSVEGQVYLLCDGGVADCDLTCTDLPFDGFCSLCKAKCRCPAGTVLDEIAKKCVKGHECGKNR